MRAHLTAKGVCVAVLLAAASCDVNEPKTGAIRVAVASSGGDIDVDGYLAVVDSSSVRVPATGAFVFDGLATGSHEVALRDVAPNCSRSGSDSLPVIVRGGDTASVSFAVTCVPTGVHVITSTTGLDPDGDGYSVTVDFVLTTVVGPNGSVDITRLAAGNHAVTLSAIAPNCRVAGDQSRSVEMTVGQVVPITFELTCSATTGAIAVTAATSGDELDPDGYTVRVDSAAPQPLAIDGTITFQTLGPGDHTVTLEGVAGNCPIAGENPRTVNVTTGGPTRDTARTTFTVTCVATTGVLRVRAVTSGGDLDPDGYGVFVDESCYDDPYYGQYCDYLWIGTVPTNGAVTPPRLSVGEHTVLVNGMARNCSLAGVNPRTATVPPGDTVEVVLTVTCELTGSVRVTVTTTGVDLDPNGYYVRVQGAGDFQEYYVGVNAIVTVPQLFPGAHSVTLFGLSGNCAVSGENPVTTTVTGGATAEVAFAVACRALGGLQMTTVTTGSELDPNGYTLQLSATNYSNVIGISTNGSVTLERLLPGDYQMTLTGATPNCTVAPPNPRTVTVPSGGTATVTFDVACTALARLQVMAVTTGVDLDPDGYTFVVQGPGLNTSGSLAANGTVTLTGLVAGEYSAWLWGEAPNCETNGAKPRTVAVPDGGTATVEFDVACTVATQLAFVAPDDGNDEIYTIKHNGTEATRLTVNAASDVDPAWSPDGTTLAFTTSRDGNYEIYVMSASGSNPVRLTNNAASDAQPVWSPDGTKIAFTSYRDGNAEIYVMNPDGSGPVRLTNNPANDYEAAWSPAGAKIAFRSERDGNAEIYVMNADGSNPMRLTNNPGYDIEPTWSPDGAKIAFVRDVEDCPYDCYTFQYLFVMNADGSGMAQVPTPSFINYRYPAWSPDGRWIAVASETCDYYSGCYAPSLSVIRPDGTRGAEVRSGYVRDPAWRP